MARDAIGQSAPVLHLVPLGAALGCPDRKVREDLPGVARTPPNRKVREGRTSPELRTRWPAGVNARRSESTSGARISVSGAAKCPDTIGVVVGVMVTMIAVFPRE